MDKIKGVIRNTSIRWVSWFETQKSDIGRCMLGAFGLFLLVAGLNQEALSQCAGPSGTCATPGYEPELVEHAVGSLFLLIEGAFGALIMVVAGIGAIIAAAMGAYRAALGMLVVAVGAFILRALVSLFFGSGNFIPADDYN